MLVDNDVNVMALGEGYMGCTQDESNFLFIKAGTGIDAGDIGHIAVDGSSGEVSFY